MKKIFISFFTLFTMVVTAQDSTNTKDIFGRLEKEEVKFLKNEFGLAIDPIIISLLGAEIWQTRWALTYRRHLNPKFSIRGMASFYFADDGTLFGGAWIYNYNSDSSIQFAQHYYSEKYKGFQLNSGLQYNWGNKKLKWFTGLDLIYKNYRNISRVDSIYTVQNTPPGQVIQSSTTEIRRNETRGNHFGIFPFIGIRAMFSKHWGFSTHFGYNLTVGYDHYYSYYYDNQIQNYNEADPWPTFTIDANSFFQDVSLIFRF